MGSKPEPEALQQKERILYEKIRTWLFIELWAHFEPLIFLKFIFERILTMLSETSKSYIEKQFSLLVKNNPFFKKNTAVQWNEELKVVYLSTLKFIFAQTCPHLAIAAHQAELNGNLAMKSFFRDKLKEETGHEAWAHSDATHVGIETKLSVAKVAAEAVELMSYMHKLIMRDYRLYLFYMLAAEYFAVLMSPVFFEKLRPFNETRESLTSISNHESADRFHILDDFEAIDSFFSSTPEEEAAMHEVVDYSFAIFSIFYLRFVETPYASNFRTLVG